MLRALALAAVAAAFAPSATAADQTGFAFGRAGGNIRPYTVVIAVNGTVRSSGPVTTRKKPLSRLELAQLNRLTVVVGFARLDKATNCPDALPDVAGTFIRVGRETVRVHGTCVAPYQRLFKALAYAARMKTES
jgi:hypothetical protein